MIKAKKISKIYNNELIVNEFSLNIEPGDFLSLTGVSGSGKTTILNMLGLLEKPDYGSISIDGVLNPNKKQTMLLQRNTFGYLFQNYALMENETVEKNLKIALEYQKGIRKESVIKESLKLVNLKNVMEKKIYQLSGGEQQRVAIARLFIKESKYILADEPTGNLDINNRNIVFDLLRKLNDLGKAIIYVTHDIELAKKANKHICI